MNDPRNIDYIVDANASEAVAEVNRFVREIGKASASIEQLQGKVNKLLGSQSAQVSRQMQSSLSSLSKGSLSTQVETAGQKTQLANIRSDAATRYVQLEKAATTQLENQKRVLGGFLEKYDQIIAARTKIRNLDKEALSGNQRAIAQQKEQLRLAKANIDAVVQSLPASAQTNMRARLDRTLADPSYTGQGRNNLANLYYKRRLGVGQTPGQTAKIVTSLDNERDMARLAREEKATLGLQQQLERDRQFRVKEQSSAEKAMHQRLLREYKRSSNRAIMSGATPEDMDRLHASKMGEFQSRYQSGIGGRFGGTPVFDTSRYDEEFAINRQNELAKREAAAARQALNAKTAMERQRANQEAAEERRRISERQRVEKLQTQPRDAAMGGVRRTEAFGGAGIFAIQGSLLANYATMAAGIGTISFLGGYVVELEAALAQLQAISGATKGEIDELGDSIMGLSRNSKFSAQELSDAATVMAQAGLTVAQIKKTLPSVVNLAVGTGTDLATTVDTITSTMTVFNLQTSEAADVANTLTAAMNLSKLSIDKYALGLQYSGNIADTVGIQYNELAAILGGMADAGIRSGSTLGTGLRQLMLDLQSPTAKADTVFKRLGLSQSDLDIESQGIFRVLRNMKEAGFDTADATQAFEVRAVAAFKALMNKLPDIESLNARILETSAATDAAAVQMDTLAAKGGQFASGAGSAFYKTTENIRESLKGLLDVLIAVTAGIQFMAPVLQVATTAGVSFMVVWGVNRILGIVKGMFEMRAAMVAVSGATSAATATTAVYHTSLAAAAGAMGRLGAVTRFVMSPMVLMTAALTAASVAFGLISEMSQAAEKRLESAREATNRASDTMSETVETVEALDSALHRLSSRYGVLSEEDSPDLRNEILQLQNRFAEYGLTLENTGENIDSVITKTAQLRGEMASLSAAQAEVAIANIDIERDALTATTRKDYTGNNRQSLAFAYQSRVEGLSSSRFAAFNASERFGPAKDAAGRYSDILLNPSAQKFRDMDLGQISRDLAALARFRSELELYKAQNPKDNSKALVDALNSVNFIMSNVSDLQSKAAEFSSLNTRQKTLSSSSRTLQMGELANSMGLDTQVIGMRGKISVREQEVKDLLASGYGVDVVSGRMGALKNDMDGEVQFILELKDDYIEAAISSKLASDRKEAEELFTRLPLYEDYKYVTTTLDRSGKMLRGEAAKVYEDMYSAAGNNSRSNSRMIVNRARARNKIDDPESGVYFEPITLNEGVTGMKKNFSNEATALRQEYSAKYQGLFDMDTGGNYKNPARVQEYVEALGKMRADQETLLAQLYKAFGIEYDAEGGSKRSKKTDERIELLRTQASALRSQLSEIDARRDKDMAPDALQAIMQEYKSKFDEYSTIATELKNLEWDDKTFKNPAIAAQMKSLNEEEFQTGLDAVGSKVMSNQSEQLKDAVGNIISAAAKARIKSLEQGLKSAGKGGSDITSKDMMDARIQLGNSMMTELIENYISAFKNDPSNRQRLDVEEVKLELQEGVAQFVVDYGQFVMNVIDKFTRDAMYAAEAPVRRIQGEISSFDSRLNRSSVSNTQRSMAAGALDTANTQMLGDNVTIATTAKGAVETQLSELNTSLAGTTEGSPEQLAMLAARDDLLQKLTDTTRDLTSATAAYAAATAVAVQPGTFQMFRQSLEDFVEAEGVLLKATETIADGLGGIFSTMNNSFQEMVSNVLTGSMSIGDAFRGMAQNILKSMLDLAIKVMTNYLIIQVIKLIATFLPGGGFSQGFADAFGAAGFGNVPVAGKALGGEVTGGVPGRDSVLARLMPGEVVMRKSAVDMIGRDTLLQANATGRLGQQTAVVMQQQKRDPDMVNVYVVSPDQKPGMSKNDIVVTLMDDVRQGGPIKKMIKQVAIGGA